MSIFRNAKVSGAPGRLSELYYGLCQKLLPRAYLIGRARRAVPSTCRVLKPEGPVSPAPSTEFILDNRLSSLPPPLGFLRGKRRRRGDRFFETQIYLAGCCLLLGPLLIFFLSFAGRGLIGQRCFGSRGWIPLFAAIFGRCLLSLGRQTKVQRFFVLIPLGPLISGGRSFFEG